jgi:hypothetical protein
MFFTPLRTPPPPEIIPPPIKIIKNHKKPYPTPYNFIAFLYKSYTLHPPPPHKLSTFYFLLSTLGGVGLTEGQYPPTFSRGGRHVKRGGG